MSGPSVLAVLPARGASGGANSIVQECIGLSRIGCRVGIAVSGRHALAFGANYPELGDGSTAVSVHVYSDVKQLSEHMAPYDVAVATVNNSVFEIREAIALTKSSIKTAYYVQDYEPLFYPVDTPEWKGAHESYSAIPGCRLFAKTDWLRKVVYENHGVPVAKVSPSLDHAVFYPDMARKGDELTIVAMLRPKTPRRAPHRTVRIMTHLSERLPQVAFRVFGCEDAELRAAGIDLPRYVENLGLLRRTEVPALLRSADLFLDLSDYQAFGRSALEGMACGCVPVLPVFGGSAEFAVDGVNAFVVDTRSDEVILEAVEGYARMSKSDRTEMRHQAIETASRFTIARAAFSEYKLFSQLVAA